MNESTTEFIDFQYTKQTDTELHYRSNLFYETLNKRRTIREFSTEKFDKKVLENILMAASTAPSGAHKQPWTFCIVENPELKSKIRQAAEKEEFENYHGRMTTEWLNDLKKFGTNHIKSFLEDAPYLIVLFKRLYEFGDEKTKSNYYVNESVGIACGMLLSAIHYSGLVALTHTPSPMNFLAEILQRPKNERAFLLIPVGFPKENTSVPNLKRKSLEDICVWY
jgi:iodotyrosine deiodinase